MKAINLQSRSLENIWTIFLTAAIPFIGVLGASLIPYTLRLPLMTVTFVFAIITFMFSDIRIRLNIPNITFFLLITYIAVSIFFTIDKESTLTLLFFYICCFPMLFLKLPDATLKRIISICYIVSTVIAISIVISVPISNCMDRYFWFIVNPTRSPITSQALARELSLGAYSGFAREMGEAAFIVNVGISISLSKFFTNHKLTKTQFSVLALQIVALLLPGKRTYLFASLICFLLFFIFSRINGKFFKFCVIILLGTTVILLLMMFIPQTATAINKLLDSENMGRLGGRSFLWKHIYSMIDEYWLFGAGFGSYNQYAFSHGLLVNNAMWKYNAHNCYLQILGELGIIGLSLFITFIISSLFISAKALRTANNNGDKAQIGAMYFSLFNQLLMTIYSFTSNPIYTKQILFIWLFTTGIALNIRNRQNPANTKLTRRSSYEI